MAEALRVFRFVLDGPLELLRIPDLDPIYDPAQNHGPLQRSCTLQPSGDEDTPLFIRGDLHSVGRDLPHVVPGVIVGPPILQEAVLDPSPDLLREKGQERLLPLEEDEPLSLRLFSEGGRKGDSSLLVHLEVVPTEESAHVSGIQWVEVG